MISPKGRGGKDDKSGLYKAAQDSSPVESKTAETPDLKPDDALLRRHGFAIHERKTGRTPIWVRHGKTYLEGAALDLCRREPAPKIEDDKTLKNPAQEKAE